MKKCLIIICVLFSSQNSFGQSDGTKFFFNEIAVALTRTDVKDDNTANSFGFGIGLYRSIAMAKRVSLQIGLEYNRTGQRKEHVKTGRFSSNSDLTYKINYLTFPVAVRFKFGEQIKFLLETGMYCDFLLAGNVTGTKFVGYPNLNTNTFVYTQAEFNSDAYVPHLHFGPSGGLGISVPVQKVELIFKTE